MENLKEVEYTKLTDEIDSNSNRIFTMFGIVSASFAALFGFGVQHGNGIIIMSSLIPAIPGLLLIASQYNSSSRIVSYIETVYESKDTNIRWETHLKKFRLANTNKKGRRITSKYQLAIDLIFLMFWFCASFLALFSAFFPEEYGNLNRPESTMNIYVFMILFGVIQLGYVYGFRMLYKSRTKYDNYKKLWEKVIGGNSREQELKQ